MAQRSQQYRPRILIVDDDAPLREVLQEMLDEQGYRVAVTGDGGAALRLLQAESFDLVLTDLHMPRMNGLELLAEISRRHLPVMSILMSSLLSGETRARAGRIGAYAQLDKPFSSQKLFSVIADGLRCRQETRYQQAG
jgi:DNA-binding NtrC family response regulator